MTIKGRLRLTGGRRLISPDGTATRPTTARVREAVMNILAPRLRGSRWLDLCSGSGVMGCEAIERGVSAVLAVERDKQCARICIQNLNAVADQCESKPLIRVVRRDLRGWLKEKWKDDPFDFIYFDPPYDRNLYQSALELLGQGSWIRRDGVLICEHRSGQEPDCTSDWSVLDRRCYGTSSLLLLSPPERFPHGGTGSRPPQKDPSA